MAFSVPESSISNQKNWLNTSGRWLSACPFRQRVALTPHMRHQTHPRAFFRSVEPKIFYPRIFEKHTVDRFYSQILLKRIWFILRKISHVLMSNLTLKTPSNIIPENHSIIKKRIVTNNSCWLFLPNHVAFLMGRRTPYTLDTCNISDLKRMNSGVSYKNCWIKA